MNIIKSISTILITFFLLSINNQILAKDQPYNVDVKSSKVNWLAKKIGGQHNGSISIQSGTLMLSKGKLVGGSFVINMKTITCSNIDNAEKNQYFISHISNDDFFEVEKFPTASLKITKVSGNIVTGDLTIKGITKSVSFPAKVAVKGSKVVASATLPIDRTEFNVKYGSKKFFDSIGDKAIDDVFTLTISLVAH